MRVEWNSVYHWEVGTLDTYWDGMDMVTTNDLEIPFFLALDRIY